MSSKVVLLNNATDSSNLIIDNTDVSATNSIIIGSNNILENVDNTMTILGKDNYIANSNNTILIGNESMRGSSEPDVNNSGGIVIGNISGADLNAVAIGNGCAANTNSVAIGNLNQTTPGSIGIGNDIKMGDNCVVIGHEKEVGRDLIVIGNESQNTISLGPIYIIAKEDEIEFYNHGKKYVMKLGINN
jgi:hypothetical protein